ncbi:MAG: hypothetical protein ABJL57_17685 [Hyphomonas sp.]|uniref:hypothetical protein n=1 Tax=Hyphomonas sp. TaxID=87 RepID=UPI003264A1E5
MAKRSKSRKRRRAPESTIVFFQPLDNLLSRPCHLQVRVYNRVAQRLASDRRKHKDGSWRAAERIPQYEAYLDAINASWISMRQQCRTNPDFFEWPSTKAWIGDGKFSAAGMDTEGVLSLFGYSVSGELGLSPNERHHILDVVFQAEIPPFASWERLLEWDGPASALRLRKMANCLASFARNGKRRHEAHMAAPVAKWTSDLQHLRLRYYDQLFSFDWPEI